MLSLESLVAMGPNGSSSSLIPPEDAHIHVTDTLDASGAFVLMQYVLAALQDKARSVIWVSNRADGLAHWNSISRKVGMPFNQFVASGRVRMIDTEDSQDTTNPFESLLNKIKDALPATQQNATKPDDKSDLFAQTLIVMDSLSVLQWSAPGSVDEVHRQLVYFLRSLRQLCLNAHAALITLQHADACSIIHTQGTLDEADERLFRYILRTADVWIAINELASGRAADCDGEITVHGLVRCAAAACTPISASEKESRLSAFRLGLPSQTCLFRILPDGTGAKNAQGIRSSVRIWSRGTGQGLI
ncbi:hypothetical protein MYAM1_002316 [Malassezia yamatoensis]|uniref:Elongator complex protein 6 n=1 Tax=Malassezia yamatoensis TaxID=253288 RepID=A0AAJ5YTN0_9BASI|nr:hypothetical protein MYAM1_002316 [Malassezia yamatoensis]